MKRGRYPGGPYPTIYHQTIIVDKKITEWPVGDTFFRVYISPLHSPNLTLTVAQIGERREEGRGEWNHLKSVTPPKVKHPPPSGATRCVILVYDLLLAVDPSC